MNKRKKTDSTKNSVSAPVPTANSEEFVPKPIDSIDDSLTTASTDIYDFIPNLKTDKYK